MSILKKIFINIAEIYKILPYTLSAFISDFKSKKNVFKKLFIEEVLNSGIAALPIVIILGFVSGVLAIVLFPFDKISFGIENIHGNLFTNIIIRELAPSLTTFVVMIRSTISITIELTQMRKFGEIDTIELLGINPLQYLGTMKIFAGILSLPVLTIYFVISALLSSMISAMFANNIPMIRYLSEIYAAVSFNDIFIFILKTLISGTLIFVIAIHHGLSKKIHRNMVIDRTIRAITVSIFTVLLVNILITVGIYAAG